jgi:hypothetical protein
VKQYAILFSVMLLRSKIHLMAFRGKKVLMFFACTMALTGGDVRSNLHLLVEDNLISLKKGLLYGLDPSDISEMSLMIVIDKRL